MNRILSFYEPENVNFCGKVAFRIPDFLPTASEERNLASQSERRSMNWVFLALFSAFFAGVTAVLAKAGVANVPSNLATLVRTVVILFFAGGIVWFRGEFSSLSTLTGKNWTFLMLSGIATGLSWLFYFAALKAGPVSLVAPIDKLSFVIAMVLGIVFLQEKVTPLTLVGAGLILAGALLTLPTVQENLQRLVPR
jgi:bacterial/archaeal transporter family protein